MRHLTLLSLGIALLLTARVEAKEFSPFEKCLLEGAKSVAECEEEEEARERRAKSAKNEMKPRPVSVARRPARAPRR